MTTNNDYSLQLKVRDYECDIQGIVNNAVYQNYLEHTRHEYLKNVGIDFADFTKRGIHLVVIRIELDYKQPLKSGDEFKVTLKISQESKLRFTFHQDIYRDDKIILKGKVIGTALNEKGRPFVPEELSVLFKD